MDALANVRQAKEAHLKQMQEAMAIATDHAATVVYEAMLAETALTDHSLQELRKLGHPYRQGAAPGNLHPDWLIHYQKGALQEGLKQGQVTKYRDSVEVGITSAAPETWYLLLGTRRMRPRDFVSAALIQTQKATSAIYEFYFKAALDKQVGSRYRIGVSPVPNDRYIPQLPKR